jgi:phage-related protein
MTSTADEKEIRWLGSSYDDLLAFPKAPRKEAGFQLGKVQAGLEPTDWKPFDEVGSGTREIRISDAKGIFRVMYVAKFGGMRFTSCTASKRSRRPRRSRTRKLPRRATEL